MVEGWVLDAYPDRVSGRMVVWLKQDDGSATRHLFDWSPVIHVHSSDEKLRSLEEMLSKPSYRYMHGGLTTHRESHYIRHGPNALEEVLAIRVGRSKSMAKIANSILFERGFDLHGAPDGNLPSLDEILEQYRSVDGLRMLAE